MYHRVSPCRDDFFPSSISPEIFEQQIRYLRSNFQIVSLEDLARSISSSTSLPKKAVAITFDDGYKDNFVYAYPILEKYCIPAIIFLITGHINSETLFWWDLISYITKYARGDELSSKNIGTYSLISKSCRLHAEKCIIKILKRLSLQKRWSIIQELLLDSGVSVVDNIGKDTVLSWSDVKEMSKGEITFGAHTVNHPILTQESMEVVRKEILQSKADIERRLSKTVNFFSYPNGYFNDEIMNAVKEAGFSCATATKPFRLIDGKDNVYCLNRIPVFSDFHLFKAMLSGITN